MKRKSLLLAACLVAVVCAIGNAHPIPGGEVELVEVTGLGYLFDSLAYNAPVTFHFAINNTEAVAMHGTTNGFRIYTDNSGGFSVSPDVNKWETTMAPYFDGGQFVSTISCDGLGSDTVGFGGFKVFNTGIPAGESVQSIDLHVNIGEETSGATELCIDSCFYPPGGEWLWNGADDVCRIPNWGGPYCWSLCWVDFWIGIDEDPVLPSNPSCCEELVTTLTAVGGPPSLPPPYNWSILDGIGEISEDDGSGAVTWSYTPSAADAGTSKQSLVKVWKSVAWGSIEMVFQFHDDPHFTSGCGELTEGVVGATLVNHVAGVDSDCSPLTCFITDVEPDPYGSVYYSSATGEIRLNTVPEDSGIVYDFTIRINPDVGDYIECVTSFVANQSPICGDVNGDLATNISDMTYLVEFLFNDGPEPVATFAADFNCDGAVNITDMTYLVGYLFNDGPAPCENCP